MDCQYCKKTFKTTSNLNYHIKNAKYCLTLRNENSDGNFQCKNCLKNFSSKQIKDIHENKCKANIKDIMNENMILKEKFKEKLQNKDEKIKELKEQLTEKDKKITELENQIERLAIIAINRPTHVQNNNQRINQIINNLTPITEQYLKDQAEFLTIEHIKDGVDGYVKYALDYPLKDKIVCTDFSRRKIKYKDEEGNLIDDPEMLKLSQKLFKAIEEKNASLVSEYIKELHERYNILIMNPNNEMEDVESTDYFFKLEMITDELFKVKDQKKEIDEIVRGNKPEIYHNFLKDVCSKSISS
jgi:hypothetical protein